MKPMIALLVASATLSIVMTPGRAAAQGLPHPTLHADFGVPKTPAPTPAPRTHQPAATAIVPHQAHRLATAAIVPTHPSVAPVDCGMRVFQGDPHTDPRIVHKPADSGALIRIVPVAPCSAHR